MKRTSILPGHYEKFVQKAKRNPKMLRIPTHEDLEKNGFNITDLFFLVLPNGLQVNPETINPDIFEDDIKGLFLCSDDSPKKPVSEQSSESSSTFKACENCGENKPISEFKKRMGRGGGYRPTCIKCETDIKENIVDSIAKDQIHVVDGKSGHIKRYVAYEDVIQLVNEAYRRGKEEGAVNIDTVHPSLDELLEIGA